MEHDIDIDRQPSHPAGSTTASSRYADGLNEKALHLDGTLNLYV